MDEDEKIKKTIKSMGIPIEKVEKSNFIPEERNDKTNFIFYGTKHISVCVRLFFTLCERLSKAKEISRTFLENEKTVLLSEEE